MHACMRACTHTHTQFEVMNKFHSEECSQPDFEVNGCLYTGSIV